MRLVYGVGTNDVVGVETKGCPYYSKWTNLLSRVYGARGGNRYESYRGTSVCEEWLTYSNFKRWMQGQDWVGKHLDKDLMLRGNKVYSSESCIFLPSKVNTFMCGSAASRGDYPIGVSYHRKDKKYYARCRSVETGENITLGRFDSAEMASTAYQRYKYSQAKLLAVGLPKDQGDALLLRYFPEM